MRTNNLFCFPLNHFQAHGSVIIKLFHSTEINLSENETTFSARQIPWNLEVFNRQWCAVC